MIKKGGLPLNLQLFAEDPAPAEGSQQNGAEGGTGDQSQQNNSGEKTFTQEEVNSIGATEKRQGKNSILKLFGCADEESAKKDAEEFKKWKENQLTDEQKRAETEAALQKTAKENEKRALAAENKLTVLMSGVNSESVEDALAIALTKVTEEKSLDKVLEEMKKEVKYSGFFGKGNSGGTGSSGHHQAGNQSIANIGKRLGEKRVNSEPKTSSFFTN